MFISAKFTYYYLLFLVGNNKIPSNYKYDIGSWYSLF